MKDVRNKLLSWVLHCGTGDLFILDVIDEDVLARAVWFIQETGEDVSLNQILTEVLWRAREELHAAFEELKPEIPELANLRGPEEDVDIYVNCQDTHIGFLKNWEIYWKYLRDKISEIEDKIGFEFEV